GADRDAARLRHPPGDEGAAARRSGPEGLDPVPAVHVRVADAEGVDRREGRAALLRRDAAEGEELLPEPAGRPLAAVHDPRVREADHAEGGGRQVEQLSFSAGGRAGLRARRRPPLPRGGDGCNQDGDEERRPVSGARTEAAAGTAGALALTGVRKSFGGVEALRGANLTCRRGEIHALIGENGAGKSTLVKVLSGAIQADVGDVELDGRPLRVRSPREAQAAGISTVFQELSLIPDLTVAGNLFYGREPRVRAGRIDYRALRSAAAEALAQLGLGWIDVAKTARELPLSDRQLLEIAKSLLREPAVLVLDEATSALLPEQVDWLFARVRAFAERGGIALFISHRLEEIQHLSHRVTVFRAGVDVGSGPIAEMPEARLVELMLGRRVDRVYPPRLPAPEGREVVCEVVGLSAPPTLRDVSLEVRRGEVLGVGGLQGQGQLPLFLALFGARRHAGQVLLERQALRLHKPADALAAGIAL